MSDQIEYIELAKVLNKYCDELTATLKSKFSKIKASGTLMETVECHIEKLGQGWTVKIDLTDYYKYIEDGRKPNSKQPPINAMIKWIKDKKILPRDKKTGRFIPTRSLAFLIGRSIAKKGIKSNPIVSTAVKEINKKYKAEIKNALGKDIKKYLTQ